MGMFSNMCDHTNICFNLWLYITPFFFSSCSSLGCATSPVMSRNQRTSASFSSRPSRSMVSETSDSTSPSTSISSSSSSSSQKSVAAAANPRPEDPSRSSSTSARWEGPGDLVLTAALPRPSWVLMCLDRWSERMNLLPHSVQANRFSPVCVRRWRCSSSERVKLLPQKSQLQTKGRSPACQRRWAFRWDVFPYTLPQPLTWQTCCFRFPGLPLPPALAFWQLGQRQRRQRLVGAIGGGLNPGKSCARRSSAALGFPWCPACPGSLGCARTAVADVGGKRRWGDGWWWWWWWWGWWWCGCICRPSGDRLAPTGEWTLHHDTSASVAGGGDNCFDCCTCGEIGFGWRGPVGDGRPGAGCWVCTPTLRGEWGRRALPAASRFCCRRRAWYISYSRAVGGDLPWPPGLPMVGAPAALMPTGRACWEGVTHAPLFRLISDSGCSSEAGCGFLAVHPEDTGRNVGRGLLASVKAGIRVGDVQMTGNLCLPAMKFWNERSEKNCQLQKVLWRNKPSLHSKYVTGCTSHGFQTICDSL